MCPYLDACFPLCLNSLPPLVTGWSLLGDAVTCVQTAILLLLVARAPAWFRFETAMCSVLVGPSCGSIPCFSVSNEFGAVQATPHGQRDLKESLLETSGNIFTMLNSGSCPLLFQTETSFEDVCSMELLQSSCVMRWGTPYILNVVI